MTLCLIDITACLINSLSGKLIGLKNVFISQ